MNKISFNISGLLIVILLMFGCAKNPRDIIIGEWKGEAEIEMPDEKDKTREFRVTFLEDGKCFFAPEGAEVSEGTYEISEQGDISTDVVLPIEEKVELELTGSLDLDKEKIELSGSFGPTEEEYSEMKAVYEKRKKVLEEKGEEFKSELPPLEELKATISFELTRVEE